MPESDSFFNRAVDRVNRLRQSAHRPPADPRTDRVPPGQHLTSGFPVLHYGGVPLIDPARWDFRVHGLVTTPLTVTWAEFGKLPTLRKPGELIAGLTRLATPAAQRAGRRSASIPCHSARPKPDSPGPGRRGRIAPAGYREPLPNPPRCSPR